jgi:hypothetical protein
VQRQPVGAHVLGLAPWRIVHVPLLFSRSCSPAAVRRGGLARAEE